MQPNSVYPDEYLEFWGDVFIDHGLFYRHIRFETFLTAPDDILRAVADCVPEFLPLLPAQREVQLRLEDDEILELQREMEGQLEQDAVIRVSNGMFVEPLHHHAYPRKKRTYA